jgi:uncharacterized membrane protein YoaK (UPF0700 family)
LGNTASFPLVNASRPDPLFASTDPVVDFLGLLPILGFFLGFWALTDIWRSKTSRRVRLIWSAIALLPIAGFLAWLAMGPRASA